MSKDGFPVFLKKPKNMNTQKQFFKRKIILKHRHPSLNPQQGYQRYFGLYIQKLRKF